MKLTKEQIRQVKAEAARLVAFYKGQLVFKNGKMVARGAK